MGREHKLEPEVCTISFSVKAASRSAGSHARQVLPAHSGGHILASAVARMETYGSGLQAHRAWLTWMVGMWRMFE